MIVGNNQIGSIDHLRRHTTLAQHHSHEVGGEAFTQTGNRVNPSCRVFAEGGHGPGHTVEVFEQF